MTISNKSALELSKQTPAKVNKMNLALPLTLISSLLIVGCTTDSRSMLTSKASLSTAQPQSQSSSPVAYTYGVRPFYLINDMDEGPLKEELQACRGNCQVRQTSLLHIEVRHYSCLNILMIATWRQHKWVLASWNVMSLLPMTVSLSVVMPKMICTPLLIY